MEDYHILTLSKQDYNDFAYILKKETAIFNSIHKPYPRMFTLRYPLLSAEGRNTLITYKYTSASRTLDIYVEPEAQTVLMTKEDPDELHFGRFGTRKMNDDGRYAFSVEVHNEDNKGVNYKLVKLPENPTRRMWLSSRIEWDGGSVAERKSTPVEMILQLFYWGCSIVAFLPFAVTRTVDAKGVEHIRTVKNFRENALAGIDRYMKEEYEKHKFDGWDVVRLTFDQFEKIVDMMDETDLITDMSVLPLEKFAIQLQNPGENGYIGKYVADGKQLKFWCSTTDRSTGEGVDGLIRIERTVNPLTGAAKLVSHFEGDERLDSPLFLPCGNWTTIEAIFNFFLYVESFMLNYKDETMDVEERVCENQSQPGKRKKHHRNAVRLFKSYTLKKAWKSKVKRKKAEIHCLAWGVRGHYRHYRNGKVIFVNSYIKGKEREKYAGKDYLLLPEAQ